ncbi:hypothetical protein E1B28_011677 [Marasmius oreades]|uniref:DUF6535 domain-containing protein n=1 Tax=Marasmius oreades TaxID=181124 RepID=A0A9P7RUS3_9AGAR|nr:uncharacterized protein E1B28_011677 [Marasmius oreades]KAG7090060.1 hypothetical protein E1B28_011677 [Marasmius oreades]
MASLFSDEDGSHTHVRAAGSTRNGINGINHRNSFRSTKSGMRFKDKNGEDVGEQPPRMWKEGDPYRFAPRRRGDPWEECLKRVDNYDDEMCRGWKEDIDTLLVFAGLFSATVTAFTIESYRWLRDDPADDTVRVLREISQKLDQNINNTIFAAVHTRPNGSFAAPFFAVRINSVWFLSLILSLSTVMLGILCKQWIREHRRDTPSASPKETLELRQIRYESLERWGVLTLLSSLPLILQLALILFFIGLLDLLWSLDFIVASLASFAIAISVFILFITTILPGYYLLISSSIVFSDKVYICPYKSPQAWLNYRVGRVLFSCFKKDMMEYSSWASSDLHLIRNHFPSSLNPREYLLRGLKWMIETFSDSTVMANHIFYCLQGLPTQLVASATGQPDETSRDVIYYNFFRNSSWDPDIGRFLAELFLRQVNSSAEGRRGISDALGSFWNLAIMDFVGEGLIPELQNELLYQIITSMKQYCADGRITLFDMNPILVVCRELWKHPSRPVRHWSLTILDDIENWLTRMQDDLRVDLIPSLAASVTEIIHEESELDPASDFISPRGAKFVRLLDEYAVSKGIDVDAYSLHDIPLSWRDAKAKILNLIGLGADYFDHDFGMEREKRETQS